MKRFIAVKSRVLNLVHSVSVFPRFTVNLILLIRGGFFVENPNPTKKSQSRGFKIPWDFYQKVWGFKSQSLKVYTQRTFSGFFGILGLCSKKIPIPGIWDFSGRCLRDFLGEKNLKSPGFGICELGSQKNPILKPPLLLISYKL